jgi:predicted SAM-dependent methyltransferase
LIGCGHSRDKKVFQADNPGWAGELITIDMSPDVGATYVRDMSVYAGHLQFDSNSFDEIGAYDSLEHWGAQGDWKAWFSEMAEYHRILKPSGTMGIIVPVGRDALADPGHTRFFGQNHFCFLNQAFYQKNQDAGTAFTDYRWFWKLNFDILFMEESSHHLAVLLQKA